MKGLFDTCILIDYLNGITAARDELALYREKFISVITWMEVLVGTKPDAETGTRTFLNRFQRIEIDPMVQEEAITLRREQRLKLPDAIIWAGARIHGLTLVTRNNKDFSESMPGIRIPYRI